jgi:predicted transcriptional regulator
MEGKVEMTLESYNQLYDLRKKPKIIELSELKIMRTKLGLSMDQVADKTGINKATISRIELERNCSYQNVKKLFEFYTSNPK